VGLKLITAPAKTAITKEEVKANLGIDHIDYDARIDSLILAATAHVQKHYGLLVEQTWELYLDEFPCEDEIEIPLFPLVSVTSVKYDDADAVEQTVDTGDYTVDAVSRLGRVIPTGDWPSTYDRVNAVRIRFVAGYPVVTSIVTTPEDIKHALHLLVGHWYENREGVLIGETSAALEMGIDALLGTYRNPIV
jgi:uncharacterized phiE125 gp8 family phage protein